MPLVPYTLYIWCFSCSNSNQIQKKRDQKKRRKQHNNRKKNLFCVNCEENSGRKQRITFVT